MEKKLRIALLAGGWSGEREVSLKSGDAVFKALDRQKYAVTRYDPRDDLAALVRDRERLDLAFVLLHGKYGEDGCIQGFLDLLRVPFVGSGVLASAMALDKALAKQLYRNAGLTVAPDILLFKDRDFSLDEIIRTLGPSTVIKPVSEGSSLGVSVCHRPEALADGIGRAFQYGREVLVEQFIEGREVTCCVMGNEELEALPVIEIVPDREFPFFDYEAKYTPGATNEICPAPLSESDTLKVQSCAKSAHRALKCRGWSRTDMILQGDRLYVLETNTIPGMTENSLVPRAARAAGMTLSELADRLIALSI